MKIGIDLDETITDVPLFFSLITDCLLKADHEVHILTYRDDTDRESTLKELKKLNIKFTQLHLAPENTTAPAWKASLAKELQLDIVIDDSPEVLAALPVTVKRMWLADPEIFDMQACVRALQNHRQLPIIQ